MNTPIICLGETKLVKYMCGVSLQRTPLTRDITVCHVKFTPPYIAIQALVVMLKLLTASCDTHTHMYYTC